MYHKRWHFSRAGCFWKNILDECQARPPEMSWWLSKEACQELGWVKIATAGCRCKESKDHRENSLFVFKIIISKWIWAWRLRHPGRQENGRCVSDPRGRRQGRAADGKERGGWSLISPPHRTLCKPWEILLRCEPQFLHPEKRKRGGHLGNDMHMPTYREAREKHWETKADWEERTKTLLVFS